MDPTVTSTSSVIESLPKEMWERVVHFGGLRHKATWELVCKLFQSLVYKDVTTYVRTPARRKQRQFAFVASKAAVRGGLRAVYFYQPARTPSPPVDLSKQLISAPNLTELTMVLGFPLGGELISLVAELPLRTLKISSAVGTLYSRVPESAVESLAPRLHVLFLLETESTDSTPATRVMQWIGDKMGATLHKLGLTIDNWDYLKDKMVALEELWIQSDRHKELVDASNVPRALRGAVRRNPPSVGPNFFLADQTGTFTSPFQNAIERCDAEGMQALLRAGFDPQASSDSTPLVLRPNPPSYLSRAFESSYGAAKSLLETCPDLYWAHNPPKPGTSIFALCFNSHPSGSEYDWLAFTTWVFENRWVAALAAGQTPEALLAGRSERSVLFETLLNEQKIQFVLDRAEIFGPDALRSRSRSGCNLLHNSISRSEIPTLWKHRDTIGWEEPDYAGRTALECLARSPTLSDLAHLTPYLSDDEFIKYITPRSIMGIHFNADESDQCGAFLGRVGALFGPDQWAQLFVPWIHTRIRFLDTNLLACIWNYEGKERAGFRPALVSALLAPFDGPAWAKYFKNCDTKHFTQPMPHLLIKTYSRINSGCIRTVISAVRERLGPENFQAWPATTNAQGLTLTQYVLRKRSKADNVRWYDMVLQAVDQPMPVPCPSPPPHLSNLPPFAVTAKYAVQLTNHRTKQR